MTKIALRKAAVVACATALMQLPLGAAAGPVDLGKFVSGVRFGYPDTVQINIADSSDTPQGGVEVRQIELQDIKDQGRTHRIAVQDGSISEADTEGAVDWLIATFPAERGYQSLLAVANLESDAHPVDPDVRKETLAALGLQSVPIGTKVGVFTKSGEQKGVLGDNASVAELLTLLEDIAAGDAVEQSSDVESVEKIATDDMAETGALASTEFNAILGELMTNLPSRSGKPPLVSATDPVIPQLRQGLTHGVLTRVTSEIGSRPSMWCNFRV